MLSEFRGFLLKTNALALAIGVIVGVALGNVVNSLVNDVIMPPIGFLLGGLDFSGLQLVLKASADPDVPDTAIRYGAFVNTMVAFAVIAFVVFWITRTFVKEPAPAEAKICPFCKEANAADATRCRACTSTI